MELIPSARSRSINELGALGVRSLRFTGGEPLLRTDFFQILNKSNTSPFQSIIIQTNGLLLKKLHKEMNDSPITSVAVSIDGLKETNDLIRGIRGYFDLAMEGIKLLRNKKVKISVTLNRISAKELSELADIARAAGAQLESNILTRSLYFTKDADLDAMWPQRSDVQEIETVLRNKLKRPDYEVDYITRYYNNDETLEEPPCVLGYLQVFVISNGDVLTGCYPLEAGRKHSEGQSGKHPGLGRVRPTGASDDSTGMSGLHLWSRELAGDEARGFVRFLSPGPPYPRSEWRREEIPDRRCRSKRYVERLVTASFQKNRQLFPRLRFLALLSSAEKHASHTNADEKNASPPPSHDAFPEKEFSSQAHPRRSSKQ